MKKYIKNEPKKAFLIFTKGVKRLVYRNGFLILELLKLKITIRPIYYTKLMLEKHKLLVQLKKVLQSFLSVFEIYNSSLYSLKKRYQIKTGVTLQEKWSSI